MTNKKNELVRVGIVAFVLFALYLLFFRSYTNHTNTTNPASKEKSNVNNDANSTLKNNQNLPASNSSSSTNQVFEPIYFIKGTQLTVDAYHKIGYLHVYLMNNINVKVKLIGYADNSGDYQKNEVLAEKRAGIVRDQLIKLNDKLADRIEIESSVIGDSKETDNSEANKLLNRKVEIKIIQ